MVEANSQFKTIDATKSLEGPNHAHCHEFTLIIACFK